MKNVQKDVKNIKNGMKFVGKYSLGELKRKEADDG